MDEGLLQMRVVFIDSEGKKKRPVLPGAYKQNEGEEIKKSGFRNRFRAFNPGCMGCPLGAVYLELFSCPTARLR